MGPRHPHRSGLKAVGLEGVVAWGPLHLMVLFMTVTFVPAAVRARGSLAWGSQVPTVAGGAPIPHNSLLPRLIVSPPASGSQEAPPEGKDDVARSAGRRCFHSRGGSGRTRGRRSRRQTARPAAA